MLYLLKRMNYAYVQKNVGMNIITKINRINNEKMGTIRTIYL